MGIPTPKHHFKTESQLSRIRMRVVTVAVAVCLWAVCLSQNDPHVIFSADHGIIDVNLTHTLKMSCSLSASSSVKHLVSIVITRYDANSNSIAVASVSTFDSVPSAPISDNAMITVDNTSSVSDDVSKSYLKLEWDHPTEEQEGTYNCEINLINMD